MDWAACGLLLLYQCNLHVYVCLVQDYVQNLALLISYRFESCLATAIWYVCDETRSQAIWG